VIFELLNHLSDLSQAPAVVLIIVIAAVALTGAVSTFGYLVYLAREQLQSQGALVRFMTDAPGRIVDAAAGTNIELGLVIDELQEALRSLQLKVEHQDRILTALSDRYEKVAQERDMWRAKALECDEQILSLKRQLRAVRQRVMALEDWLTTKGIDFPPARTDSDPTEGKSL
jgi:hypothetical protein